MSKSHELTSPARRSVLRAAAAVGSGLLVSPAILRAQSGDWPNRPISLVVGYPPGGQTDFIARLLSSNMQADLGQTLVVENRGGANGNIGATNVLNAEPDGYRLLVGNGAMTISPHTFVNTPVVDPQALTPIGIALTSALVLVVPSTSSIKTFEELVSMIKERDKQDGIHYGSSGAGGLTHVTMELLRERIGKPQMTHIPYKGAAPAAVDLIAGRVDCSFDASSVVAPYIKSGQMRPLMVTSKNRVAALPDVPTAEECGIEDFDILSFIGLYGPPGLDQGIVAKINASMNSALSLDSVRKSITDVGDEPGGGTPEELAEMTRAQFELWGPVVKRNGIQVD